MISKTKGNYLSKYIQVFLVYTQYVFYTI